MNVLRAEAMGLCFGVRDALRVAAGVSDPPAVTIHGQLVHNERVLQRLGAQGFQQTAEAERDKVPDTPNVLVTAHGISDWERRRLESAGKRLIDTTCPLVRRVHLAAQSLQQDGYHVLVIGRRDHVEVRGIVEDLASFDILESPADVRGFNHAKLGLVCQTTTSPVLARRLDDLVRAKNPGADIRFLETICQPTLDRQDAVERLLQRIDAMVVVGGRNSNNTRQLVNQCRAAGIPAWHIQAANDLDQHWFRGIATVGLTAGTSTLDETIDDVETVLRRLPAGIPTTSRRWCNHFHQNAGSQLAIPWDDPSRLSDNERAAVGRSIQIFQLGESGRGSRLVRAATRYSRRLNDPLYVDALRLFIKEEQRHASYLGRYLKREGLPLIDGQWTNKLFRSLRNLAGLELMLTILLAAELIANVYYAALRRATKSAVLQTICSQILRDERWHVRFQCQRLAMLRAGRSGLLRWLTRWTETAVFRATCFTVWITHARAFRAGGQSFRSYWRRTGRELASTQKQSWQQRESQGTEKRRATCPPPVP